MEAISRTVSPWAVSWRTRSLVLVIGSPVVVGSRFCGASHITAGFATTFSPVVVVLPTVSYEHLPTDRHPMCYTVRHWLAKRRVARWLRTVVT